MHRIETSNYSHSASNGKSHMGRTDPEVLFCWNRSIIQAIVSAMTKCAYILSVILLFLILYFSTYQTTDFEFAYFSYGATCAEVELDVLTGETQVIRVDILYDCGER